jgi:hypothetical protein
MSEIVYQSNVRIEHLGIPFNRAYLPPAKETVLFGVHGKVAEHYRIPMDKVEPCATTLDYIVASAGGCLTGTFAGILKGRKIPLGLMACQRMCPGRLNGNRTMSWSSSGSM